MPEPGLVAPLSDPELLQYKILIHMDSVTEFDGADEPWFLRAASDRGQSGVLEVDDDGLGGPSEGRRSHTRNLSWRFGVRDRRGLGSGAGAVPEVRQRAALSPEVTAGAGADEDGFVFPRSREAAGWRSRGSMEESGWRSRGQRQGPGWGSRGQRELARR